MPRLTSTIVNATLAANGHDEHLTRGNGYWYFTDGKSARWRSTSVYVCRIGDLTLDEWIAEHRTLSADTW